MDRIGGICGVPGGYDSGEKLIEVWEERKLESKNVCCRKKEEIHKVYASETLRKAEGGGGLHH